MKVIDIMQKLANGKNIKKFRIDDVNYYVDKSNYICEEDGTRVEWYIDDEWLNTNAEIIEEDKKIGKITLNDNGTIGFPNGQWTARNMDKAFAIKINEIIDYINGGTNGE